MAAIPKEKLDSYQTFEVLGKVEGIDLEARAKVSVEGIVSVEEVSVTTQSQKHHNYQKAFGHMIQMVTFHQLRLHGMRFVQSNTLRKVSLQLMVA